MDQDQLPLIFGGSSHPALAKQVAKGLGTDLGKVSLSTFPDREIGVQFLENVRGREVFVLQTIARRPNHYLMELLIMIDALKRASAKSIDVVVPYFGYSRQDRKDKGRVPITAKLVADLLEKAGANRILTMDLHAQQIQGFFNIAVDHLFAKPVFTKAVKESGVENVVVAAPDLGSIKVARDFASSIGADLAIVDKRRVDAEHVEIGGLIGHVKERDVILIDDMISTGKTLETAAKTCKKAGAKAVYACATHGLFAEGAFSESAIEKLFVTDTVPLPPEWEENPRISVVSVASLFSRAIEAIVSGQSLSSLQKMFEQ